MKELKLSNSNKFALVDDEDWERLSKLTWTLNPRGNIYRSYYGNACPLANEVIQDNTSQVYDHKNQNSFDNQKSNLRKCTQQSKHG